MTTTAWVLLIIAAAAIVLAGLIARKFQRSRKIQSRFGPEYDHLVRERGSTAQAEKELEHRAKRVDAFQIRPLSQDESNQFAEKWRRAQERFVDEPRGAVTEASELLHEVMKARGYPTSGDFDEEVADLSVNHPRLVEHYRAAHGITVRDSREPVGTEDLREAMKHYRALFEDLLDRRVSELHEVKR
jgi:hypothetical protein